MVFNTIVAVGLVAGYIAAGYHQRGFVDWLGLLTLAFLIIPIWYALFKNDDR